MSYSPQTVSHRFNSSRQPSLENEKAKMALRFSDSNAAALSCSNVLTPIRIIVEKLFTHIVSNKTVWLTLGEKFYCRLKS